jgi:uncharacterized repeat protein (TIGR02543 family)
MASPQESANKEVKVEFDVVRTKKSAARSKLISALITVLISGFLVSIPVTANAAACVPTSTIVAGDTVLTFTTVGSCEWSVPVGITTADVLVVGGGGAGGTSSNGAGGGGGGGQVNAQASISISGVITLQIGAGGIAQTVASATAGGNGGTSSFTRTSGSVISASGGSGGASVAVSAVGSPSATGYNGGGGSVHASTKTIGSNGVGGYKGGNSVGSSSTADAQAGGGGGGSGGNGSDALTSGATNGGAGGVGVSNSYIGSATFYGGGGGGGKRNASTGTVGSGGSGGGGAGGKVANGVDATANTGGGGGGAGGEYVGGDGGSGVVIVRYSPPANTSLITFNSNGGSDSDYFMYQATGTSGNLPDRTSFLRTGFEFVGWNSAANGSGTTYALGGAITISADTTLFAQWSRITSPSCAANVGKGGIQSTTLASTKAGNGCVAISFAASGVNSTVTFNYTGADQSWTVPTGVTSATFYLFGAGGGGNSQKSGGGGGYATGAYSVTAGQVYTVIVGEGGGAETAVTVAGLTGKYTKVTYGGGGRGGSTAGDAYKGTFASGGGRSAIRAPGASTDLATAAGGGGGGYGICGFGGGGLSGVGDRGGTQTAGGASAWPAVSGAAGNGSAYRGGDSNNEGGGGGGGYFGGGDGGNNEGGGGGSSYIALLRNGATTSGASCSGALAETVGIGNIVTYNANSATSGTIPTEAIVAGGRALTASANTGTLALTNFTFGGWNTVADGSGTTYAVGSTTFIPTSNTTLYAQWNSTITFNANGGTGASSFTTTTAKGTGGITTLASQGTLTKTGAVFSGWNTAANGTGTRYAAGLTTYAASGSVTLYAQWTLPTGTPTLDSGSDLGTSSTDKKTADNTPTINIGTLVSGAVVTLTATPSSGSAVTCTFTAGSTSGSCTFSTLADGTYSFTATQTYNGGTSAVSSALSSVQIDATRPTVVLTSNNVVSGGNLTATPSTPTVSTTITVTFSESVSGLLISEITKNAESTGWAITTTSFTNAAISAINFTASNTTGAGGIAGIAKFSVAAGVASDVAGNTNTATASDFIINTLIQLTLSNEYQQSPPLSPVVGGSGGTIAQTTPGQAITLPGQLTLSRVGHTFAGWSLVTTDGSGAVVGATYTPTVPVKLYSSWTPNVFVVTYDANGGNGAPATTSQSFTYGGTALSPSARGTLARTGYTFGGWSTTAVASGTIYSNTTDNIASTTTTYRPSASITLYAKWTAGTYTVSFNGNSSTGGSTASMSITAGTAKALTTNGFTRTGYTFAGWTTAADGTGTSYANLASVTLYGDTTIYAKWVMANPGAPSVASASAGNTTVAVTVTGVSESGTTTSNVATGVVGPTSSYTIEAFSGLTATGKTCTVQAGTSPLACTISGLTNGTAYGFKVTATNTTGSATGSMSASTYSPAPYVVTYAANGGTLTPTATTANYNFGTPVTLPLATKAGYTFTGWNSPSVGLNGASYSPTASITLTAQWSAITYSVTYSGNGSNGGTVPSTGSYTYGSSYSISEDGNMTKSGYNFAGWATASDGTGTLYANANDSIASSTATYAGPGNLTLYAKWTAQVYAITYDVNGATGAASKSSDSFTFGGTALVLPTIGTMVKTNYTFGGWSETSSGVAVTSPYSPTQTRTLYAVWSGVQYSISYNSNGGLGTVNDVLYTTGATGVTLNDGSGLSRTGYTFSGWKTSAGASVSTPYVATSNITLNAVWTAKTVTITYAKGIATTTTNFPAGSNATYGANFVLSTNVDTSTAVGPDNYKFAGWYETTTATTYKPGDNFRISTEANLTFTAQWIRLYEVTYNANGGIFAGSDGINDSECPEKLCATGQTITLHSAPSRTGFTFSGWVDQSGNVITDIDTADGAPGIQTTIIDTRYIFYATWSPNSYTITFAQGAGSDGGASPITGTHGEIVTLALTGTYSLTGSVFTGWLIGSTTYPAGALYTLGTNATPITATAQYANNTFKIFYNSNGGTSTPNPTSALSGASITLDPATSFTKDGYDFDGWSDGTQKLAASFATTMGSANSTLIAQWRIKLPAAPTFSSVTGVDGGANIVVAPGSGGGSPTSYTVTSSPSGGSCTIYAPATSCSVSPLNNGTAYTFTVSATNSTGTTNGATSSSSVTPAGKPGPPTGVSAVRGNGQATVTFTAPADTGGSAITSYTVTAYDSSGNAAGTCTGSGTTYTCTGLTNGAAYTFKATATNALFTSDLSTASSAATPATVPNTPTSVAAAVTTAGAATVSFTAPLVNGGSAITGFTVTSSPGGFTCTAAADASSCVVSGLTNGTAYTFSVIATNEIGNSVASSASSAATPQSNASAPTTITATAGDGQASIAFSGAVTNGSTIANYTVQAYDGDGNVVEGATCTSSTSPCTITGLTNGSTYTFKVVTNSTVYGAGSTTASSQSSASNAVVPAKVPDAPSSVEVTPGTGKVTVSWDAPSSNGSAILSYSVQAYNSSGEAVTGATCTATTLTCDVSSNLVAGSNYTFKVTATNAVGTSPASSASSSAAINAAPSAPLNVTAVASNASATASWDAPANINGSAVTGYTATAYDSNNNAQGTCTTNASTLTCSVTGLTNGSPYTFKVSATNGIGTSAASSASSAVTPSTVPNPPTNITVAASDAAVAVSFLAPSNTGGSDILRYEVTSNPGDLTCTVNAPTRSCTIAGLTNGTAYTFTVKAINANGSSVASSASSSVTPVKSSAPTIASLTNQPTGNPYVGSTLTSNMSFNGSPIPTVTYQWKVCDSATDVTSCTNLAGATSSTYIPTISELEKFIVVTATATNGIAPDATETSVPTQVINPEIIFTGPSGAQTGTVGTALVISLSGAGGVGTFAYTISSGTLPSGLTLDPATGQIAGTPTTAGTYTFTVRVTDSNGVYKEVVITIAVAAATTPSSSGGGTPAPSVDPTPQPITCDSSCQAAKDAAATKAAADKAAADAIAKSAADKAVADAAAAAKTQSDTAATTASTKAAADAAAAAAAAKTAIDKAAAAAVAQVAADAAAKAAAAQAKAASDAQAVAAKAAGDAAAALKNATATTAAKAAATANAQKAAAAAAAAVKAAATTAQKAATAKNTAANANKQVEIAINSLNSKTAASQASAQANAIAAAAKAAANEAAAAAATKASEAKAVATAAQKAAAETAARIATEQKQAADAAARAKIAAEAAAKATAEKVSAIAAATKAAEDLAKVLADKAALAEQAAKETDQTARAEIQKKIEEVSTKVEEVQKTLESATTKADEAVAAQATAVEAADTATKDADAQAAEAVAVKTESVVKTAEATKAVAAATVATKVAAAAKAAAAKVPSKAVITTKPSSSTSKNGAKATVTGLKPGQKVKVTVNVKPKP